MEKYEKINRKKRNTVKIIVGVVCVTSCVVLLWGLLGMNEEGDTGGRLGHAKNKLTDEVRTTQGEHKVLHKDKTDHHIRPHRRDHDEHGAEDNDHPEFHIHIKHEEKGEGRHVHGLLAKTKRKTEERTFVERVQTLDEEVRTIKSNLAPGHFMETDEKGVAASKRLQDATRLLLHSRFGSKEPYRVRVDLIFQESNPTFAAQGATGSFVIELAPSSLQPHSIFTFLEEARLWEHKKGAFHRRANHVLQVMVNGRGLTKHLAFQEYSPDFPHEKGTVGYAGRPSGPEWYVSILNNVAAHGPGSQQKENPHEADSCFGKVVEGFDDVVLGRIAKMPGEGFLKAPAHVLIDKMTILVPDHVVEGTWSEWKPRHAVADFDFVTAKLQ